MWHAHDAAFKLFIEMDHSKPLEWQCLSCTVLNPAHSSKCFVCRSDPPAAAAAGIVSHPAAASGSTGSPSSSAVTNITSSIGGFFKRLLKPDESGAKSRSGSVISASSSSNNRKASAINLKDKSNLVPVYDDGPWRCERCGRVNQPLVHTCVDCNAQREATAYALRKQSLQPQRCPTHKGCPPLAPNIYYPEEPGHVAGPSAAPYRHASDPVFPNRTADLT